MGSLAAIVLSYHVAMNVQVTQYAGTAFVTVHLERVEITALELSVSVIAMDMVNAWILVLVNARMVTGENTVK